MEITIDENRSTQLSPNADDRILITYETCAKVGLSLTYLSYTRDERDVFEKVYLIFKIIIEINEAIGANGYSVACNTLFIFQLYVKIPGFIQYMHPQFKSTAFTELGLFRYFDVTYINKYNRHPLIITLSRQDILYVETMKRIIIDNEDDKLFTTIIKLSEGV